MQEAGCWPSSLSWTVVGFGATGEDGEVVGSVCPYLPLVAVSDSVVEGEVECQRGRDEGVDVGSAWKVGFKREEAGSVSVSRWEDKEDGPETLWSPFHRHVARLTGLPFPFWTIPKQNQTWLVANTDQLLRALRVGSQPR